MKRFLRSKLVLTLAALIMIAAAVVIPLSGSVTHSFAASRSSHNIAYVNYNDLGFTESGVQSANIFADSVVNSPSPTSSPTDSVTYNGMTFTPLAKSAISTSTLAPFDTLILFEVCDIATSLSASQHAAINAFLAAGNKILLYDADRCAVGFGGAGNADYSWFTFPFSTSAPGPQGQPGTLTIVEKSTLTTSPNILANDPFNSDELGDANTATTSNPHWFAAAKTTNALGNTGFFLAYARNKGLIIYDGADHWFTRGPTQSLTDLFVNELDQQYDPDNLPSTTPIAPPIAYNLPNQIWSGYSATGKTFTTSEGSWIHPKATCKIFKHAIADFWIGLDGQGSNTVEQTGTETQCIAGVLVNFAWWEMYPDDPHVIFVADHFKLATVSAGDRIHAKVSFVGTSPKGEGMFKLEIENLTAGWHFSTTQKASLKQALRSSAECIVERDQSNSTFTEKSAIDLTNFGTVHFQSCLANGKPIATQPSLYRWILKAYKPKQPNLDRVFDLTPGSAFDVKWISPGP